MVLELLLLSGEYYSTGNGNVECKQLLLLEVVPKNKHVEWVMYSECILR